MSDFTDRWGNLTVGDAIELNKIAKETCGNEYTVCIGEDYEKS